MPTALTVDGLGVGVDRDEVAFVERSHDDVDEQRLHTTSAIREADGLVVGEVAALECGAGVVVDGDLALEGGGDIEGSWLVGTGPTGTRTCLRPAGLLGDGPRASARCRCGQRDVTSLDGDDRTVHFDRVPVVSRWPRPHPGRPREGRRAASNVGRTFVVTAGSLALSPARCRGPESTDRVDSVMASGYPGRARHAWYPPAGRGHSRWCRVRAPHNGPPHDPGVLEQTLQSMVSPGTRAWMPLHERPVRVLGGDVPRAPRALEGCACRPYGARWPESASAAAATTDVFGGLRVSIRERSAS